MKHIILFPYAGSLGLAYNQWRKELSKFFHVHIINYNRTGKEKKYSDSQTYQELIDKIVEELSGIMTEGEYVFYGHSMGTRVICSVYDQLVKKNMILPEQVILSGAKDYSKPVESPYAKSKEAFMEEYIALGGISDEVIASTELYELVTEELIKDVYLLSQFDFVEISNKFRCPVEVMIGTQDKNSTKKEWEEVLGQQIEYQIFEGKHFFIYNREQEVLQEIERFA